MDSDSDEDNTPKKSPQFDSGSKSQSAPVSGEKRRSAAQAKQQEDDDFLDDDPEEMAELMRDFKAPTTYSGKKTLTNNAVLYKGMSSNTSSSIRYGAGGIRGIQHQSLKQQQIRGEIERDSDTESIFTSSVGSSNGIHNSANNSNSAINSANANRLMHIKPGQAIRVKAPSKISSLGNSRTSGQQNAINTAFS